MPTALIVEDEPVANQLLATLVRLRGYQTESAFTGGDAIRSASARRPDLVFLDLMLPDINGYDVCQALRSDRATAGIPVVMVTARIADANRVQGFRAGAVDYVPKPYLPDQIFAAIARADTWRAHLGDPADLGPIAIDPRDDVGHLRGVSALRGRLLARTGLDGRAVDRLDRSLVEILQRGFDWGRDGGQAPGPIARLDTRIEAEAVVFHLRDESGWLRADDPREPALSALIASGGFDEPDFDGGRTLTLTLRTPGRPGDRP